MSHHEHSFRSKAVHFVSDLTTVLLNPISDEPLKLREDAIENRSQQESTSEDDSGITVDGPDTSSFSAFLYSLLSPESGSLRSMEEQYQNHAEMNESVIDPGIKKTSGRKTLFGRSKQALGRAMYQAIRVNGFRNQVSDQNVDCNKMNYGGNDPQLSGLELGPVKTPIDTISQASLPEISEPSLLLSEKTRSSLYVSLPALVQGRKWVLLYSTWRHGISLSTLYRRSAICPGFTLLVVGDQRGAIFGGLVEAPLRATNKRKYQGTNNTFVFTNTSGNPAVFRPTGANRYFTLCSSDFLALGGGGHFALYLDGDLLSGSSSVSETFGNPCLAHTEDFEVKEVELWGFAYASNYEETVAFSRTEAPGICRW
ncbi:TLDc [Macleaya cordata]|uniref:Oxidation resistance protein 1 n=1 Tax=Macleaya cordata TaxID=56857 RepID=A0A200PM75_MACCD|nr:TLDc [Macleaya cordata]